MVSIYIQFSVRTFAPSFGLSHLSLSLSPFSLSFCLSSIDFALHLSSCSVSMIFASRGSLVCTGAFLSLSQCFYHCFRPRRKHLIYVFHLLFKSDVFNQSTANYFDWLLYNSLLYTNNGTTAFRRRSKNFFGLDRTFECIVKECNWNRIWCWL